MIKRISAKMQRLELQKSQKLEKINQIKAEVKEIDIRIKKLDAYKKEFEKLENDIAEILKG